MVNNKSLLLAITYLSQAVANANQFLEEFNALFTSFKVDQSEFAENLDSGFVVMEDIHFSEGSKGYDQWYEAMTQGTVQELVSKYYNDATLIFVESITKFKIEQPGLRISRQPLDEQELAKWGEPYKE